MNTEESFDNSSYADEVHVEECELSAFVSAVREMFGSEQARLAAEDWLHESELMDSPPRSTSRDWRAVTIAASARLADRLAVGLHRRTPPIASTDTKVSPTPSYATILLLHGLPSSSRMFEPLFRRLSDRYHLVAPDYPGPQVEREPACQS
ncbi:MAG: alpha/beta fold hydrolase [Candidatus Sulfotelmatobacter sp.]